MKTKNQDFDVLVPNIEGTAIAERVTVQIPVRFSAEIGEWVLTPEAHEIIDTTKARHMGLLLPEQFKELRKRLKFSQKEMGELFQAGEKSWTRWESGSQRPSRSISLLIRALYEGELTLDYLLKQAGKTPAPHTKDAAAEAASPWINVLRSPPKQEPMETWHCQRDTAATVLLGMRSTVQCNSASAMSAKFTSNQRGTGAKYSVSHSSKTCAQLLQAS